MTCDIGRLRPVIGRLDANRRRGVGCTSSRKVVGSRLGCRAREGCCFKELRRDEFFFVKIKVREEGNELFA